MEIVEKNVVEKEVIKELSWKEKIIVKIFNKTFYKVYNISRIKTVNELLK